MQKNFAATSKLIPQNKFLSKAKSSCIACSNHDSKMVKEPINPGDFWIAKNWRGERRCYSALFIQEKLNETIPDNEETEDDAAVRRFHCLSHSPEGQLGWEPLSYVVAVF
ncbi:hypothetical protein CDAR_72461 [Caerostris darwini]|uniref:Uncharacterized protein n=1 Tax=Caerostris darwini TaxID=1538125 RepID=A0AAV4MKL6_9ARAC|nr:hypothetical protein CDAR_72461 [Caerostris darwini]